MRRFTWDLDPHLAASAHFDGLLTKRSAHISDNRRFIVSHVVQNATIREAKSKGLIGIGRLACGALLHNGYLYSRSIRIATPLPKIDFLRQN